MNRSIPSKTSSSSQSNLRALYQSSTLNELLHTHSQTIAEKVCVTVSNDHRETSFTYRTLLEKATLAGHWIAQNTKVGDRVLLAMPTSPEFVEYFFGCLLTGRIAVPLPVEKSTSRFSRISSVLKDCAPQLAVFRTSDDFEKMKTGLENIEALIVQELASSHSARAEHKPFVPSANQVAFIQYTSGSTSEPKGVVLTHQNILANLRMIQQGMQITPDERVVSWLPLHHDMGLIGNLLSFVAAGAFTYLYPYQEFARNPLSWLEAMSKVRATLSGAPTFAFDLIGKRMQKSQELILDLTSIRLLYCGSERISKDAIENFFQSLAPSGLKAETFFPCYGLAEASLYVSGAFQPANSIQQHTLNGRHYPLCGNVANGLAVQICDEENRQLPLGEVGEIQIGGASVSVGYWRQIEATITDGLFTGANQPWLKTGDLGVLTATSRGNQIAITGRKKDLLKIRGRNIYPEDIELEVEKISAWLPTNSVAAFTQIGINGNAEEKLTLVIEVHRHRRDGPFDDLMNQVQAILSDHDLRFDQMVIVSPGSLPKTSSGKKQRSKTAAMLENGALKEIWNSSHEFDVKVESTPPAKPQNVDSAMSNASNSTENATNGSANSPLPIRVPHDLRFQIEYLKSLAKTVNLDLADERRSFPGDFISKLHRHGFLALLIPESLGGLGYTHSEFSQIGEALGAVDLSVGGLVGNHNTIGVLPIMRSTTLLDKNSVLSDIAKNGALAAFALTEPVAGSNPRGIQSMVKSKAGKLFLDGEKIWIGNAQFAEYISVFAKEISPKGEDLGISGFLLRRSRHTYEVCEEQLTVGLKAMPQNRILFKQVELSESDRLSPPGQGLKLAFSAMEYARFGLAALAIGAMKSSLNKTVDFAKTRNIWTGVLAENSYFKQNVARLSTYVSALESVVGISSTCLDKSGELSQIASLTCKILAGEWSSEAADRCLQFAGGRGYTETFGLARIWRDARVIRIFEGPTETVAFQLGSMILREPKILDQFIQDHARTPSTVYLTGKILETIASCEREYLQQTTPESFNVLVGVYIAKALGLALVQKTHSHADDAVYRELVELQAQDLILELKRASTLQKLNFFPESVDLPRTTPRAMYDTWAGETSATPMNEGSDSSNVTLLASALAPVPLASITTLHRPADKANDVHEQLELWLKKHTRVGKIDRDQSIAQYGVDSLLAYELLCYVEESFKVIIPEAVIAKKPSLNDLASLIYENFRLISVEGSTTRNVG